MTTQNEQIAEKWAMETAFVDRHIDFTKANILSAINETTETIQIKCAEHQNTAQELQLKLNDANTKLGDASLKGIDLIAQLQSATARIAELEKLVPKQSSYFETSSAQES